MLLCFYEFDSSMYLIQVESYNICLFVTYFTKQNVLKIHPCYNVSEFLSLLWPHSIPLYVYTFPYSLLPPSGSYPTHRSLLNTGPSVDAPHSRLSPGKPHLLQG